jgi:replicative DNA helicase
LGSVLLWPGRYHRIVEHLRPDAFYRSDHERIWRTIREIYRDGGVADRINVYSYLKEFHPQENITADFLANLTDNVRAVGDLDFYVNQVMELADKRRSIKLWQHIGERLKNGGDPGPLLP